VRAKRLAWWRTGRAALGIVNPGEESQGASFPKTELLPRIAVGVGYLLQRSQRFLEPLPCFVPFSQSVSQDTQFRVDAGDGQCLLLG
jgi:hypothetical protein